MLKGWPGSFKGELPSHSVRMENVMQLKQAGILYIGLAAFILAGSVCLAQDAKQRPPLTAYRITNRVAIHGAAEGDHREQ